MRVIVGIPIPVAGNQTLMTIGHDLTPETFQFAEVTERESRINLGWLTIHVSESDCDSEELKDFARWVIKHG